MCAAFPVSSSLRCLSSELVMLALPRSTVFPFAFLLFLPSLLLSNLASFFLVSHEFKALCSSLHTNGRRDSSPGHVSLHRLSEVSVPGTLQYSFPCLLCSTCPFPLRPALTSVFPRLAGLSFTSLPGLVSSLASLAPQLRPRHSSFSSLVSAPQV